MTPQKLSSITSKILFGGLSASLASFLLPATAPAEFQLENSKLSSSFQASLKYTARTAPKPVGEEIPITLPAEITDGFGPGPFFAESDLSGLAVESCLLATSGLGSLSPDDLSIQFSEIILENGSRSKTADLSESVTIKPVRVGSFDAIQVIVDPTKALDEGGAYKKVKSFTLDISATPAQPSRTAASTRSIDDFPSARLFARHAFLNGSQIKSIPVASQKATRGGASLPQAPGDTRLAYRRGDEVLSVPLAELGIVEGEVAGLRLEHHGDILPIGGVENGEVWFYAPRRHTLTDVRDAIFVTTGSANPSPMMSSRPAISIRGVMSREVALERSRLYDWNNRYENTVQIDPGTRFFFYRVQNPFDVSTQFRDQATSALPVYDLLTSTTVTVRIEVHGRNQSPILMPDHVADFSLEGVSLPQVSWEGQTMLNVEMDVSLPSIPGGPNFELVHTVPDPVNRAVVDQQNLDIVELTWTGKPRVDENGFGKIEVPAVSRGLSPRLTIGGFPGGTTSQDVVLLDLTNPANPVRLTNPPTFIDESGTVAIGFEAGEGSVFHAQVLGDAAEPDLNVPAVELPSAFPTGSPLKGVYVRDPAFAASLSPLLSNRPEYMELDPQAAYDVFNGGQQSPEAIRNAFKVLLDAAPARDPFPHLILVGNGTYDLRDYLGIDDGITLPMFVQKSVPTSVGTIENSVDLDFSLLAGNDNLPDAVVSRIPARNSSELTLMVNKALRHDAATDTLRAQPRLGVFVADDDFLFESDMPGFASLWEQANRPSETYLVSNGTAAATNGIISSMEGPNGGVAYALYQGHGNFDTWAGEKVMTGSIVNGIDTPDKWPLVSTFTCLNHFYAFPTEPEYSLGESWLFAGENKGAIASIAPCSIDSYGRQRELAEAMLEVISLPDDQRPESIGDLYMLGQIRFLTDFPILMRTAQEYLLFGDPGSSLTLDLAETTPMEGFIVQ